MKWVITPQKEKYIDRCQAVGMSVTAIAKSLEIPVETLRVKLDKRMVGDDNWHGRNPVRYGVSDEALDNRRDERTVAIYLSLRTDVGQTTQEISKKTGYSVRLVQGDVAHLERGGMAKRVGWKWYSGYAEEAG